jgi:FixJ family two-component response regulator
MITIVDDDPSIRRALRRLLRSVGFHVETFASAQDFLDFDRRKETECIILDIHLMGMSGFELSERISEQGFYPPIIYITAHDDEQSKARAIQSGAIAYLRKPFNDHSLIDAIRKAVSGGKK